ncbi:MAG: DUF294 nucleotidyltransferase-like domain-containing protein [Verrucomicrobia bacterium]|nr:DUF294 nucleotidyltransferase-like domain-containing protein [Verrucomicrobiota bacterium]
MLDNGRLLATARTAIYTELVADWAAEQHRAFGYDRPFAVVALGGTGRAEMAPCSDNDFAFLFEEALEGNAFLLALQAQVMHARAFVDRCGFVCQALPFQLDDVPTLEGKQLNAFLDVRPVYDPNGLTTVFRERIRATFDPFLHFLHVRGFWRDQWEKASRECERLDRFDIKNDGLRVFLAGIWTLAGQRFRHSHEVYAALEDPRDLAAYDFLLRIRAFIHLRQRGRHRPLGGGNHAEDVLGFEDFTAFGDLLGPEADERTRFDYANDVRARLLAARRRVARFAKGIIEQELKQGRPVGPGNPIIYGPGGLYHATAPDSPTPRERSRAALSLLLASQKYGVPIDPAETQRTFRNAGDWLVRVPELSALFYEPRGSLADTFAFLAQFEGAEDRLFPGYAKFEVSLDARVMAERRSLRGALEREKLRALERYVTEGRARLGRAIGRTPSTNSRSRTSSRSRRLGWMPITSPPCAWPSRPSASPSPRKTRRCAATPPARSTNATPPACPKSRSTSTTCPTGRSATSPPPPCGWCTSSSPIAARSRPGPRRASTMISTSEISCGCSTTRPASACSSCSPAPITPNGNPRPRTRPLVQHPRALPQGDATLPARPGSLCRPRGCRVLPEQLLILKDFGEAFFGGVYRQHANRFGSHLLRLADSAGNAGPRADVLRDGECVIVAVAARDYRGLAATFERRLLSRKKSNCARPTSSRPPTTAWRWTSSTSAPPANPSAPT